MVFVAARYGWRNKVRTAPNQLSLLPVRRNRHRRYRSAIISAR